MFSWLFMKPPDKEVPLYCIPDMGGFFLIDKEYKELGEREGWLVFSGYYRDQYNRLVYTYRHI